MPALNTQAIAMMQLPARNPLLFPLKRGTGAAVIVGVRTPEDGRPYGIIR